MSELFNAFNDGTKFFSTYDELGEFINNRETSDVVLHGTKLAAFRFSAGQDDTVLVTLNRDHADLKISSFAMSQLGVMLRSPVGNYQQMPIDLRVSALNSRIERLINDLPLGTEDSGPSDHNQGVNARIREGRLIGIAQADTALVSPTTVLASIASSDRRRNWARGTYTESLPMKCTDDDPAGTAVTTGVRGDFLRAGISISLTDKIRPTAFAVTERAVYIFRSNRLSPVGNSLVEFVLRHSDCGDGDTQLYTFLYSPLQASRVTGLCNPFSILHMQNVGNEANLTRSINSMHDAIESATSYNNEAETDYTLRRRRFGTSRTTTIRNLSNGPGMLTRAQATAVFEEAGRLFETTEFAGYAYGMSNGMVLMRAADVIARKQRSFDDYFEFLRRARESCIWCRNHV